MIVHGSPAGFAAGCRSRGGCPHAGSETTLTCVDASIARRRDYEFARLPATQVLPRSREEPTAKAGPLQGPTEVHGTWWGYRRGCTSDHGCPNWELGRVTCAEARRRYVAKWKASRREGTGRSIEHGTSNGYLLGCRDRCPGDGQGMTCSDARTRYKLERARAAGVHPRDELVPADEIVRVLRQWVNAGRSIRSIARATGCGKSTLTALLTSSPARNTRVTPTTARRIMLAEAA